MAVFCTHFSQSLRHFFVFRNLLRPHLLLPSVKIDSLEIRAQIYQFAGVNSPTMTKILASQIASATVNFTRRCFVKGSWISGLIPPSMTLLVIKQALNCKEEGTVCIVRRPGESICSR